jgi:hypothetical protein
MSNTHSRQFRRQDTSSFDPKMFYTLNNLVLPRYTLSASTGGDPNALINVTQYGSLSSENWQLFYQQGRYFIRNYDYGAGWQLGLSQNDPNAPKMYARSGSISQQWTLSQVDGGWTMQNGLAGSGSVLGMPSGWSIPAMRTGETDGSVWNITSNESAARSKPLQGDFISSVSNVEGASTTPTPTPTSISPTSATPTNPNLTGLPTLSGGATATPSSLSTPSTSKISSGAIAGIAIGAIALLGIAIFALWFFLFRKKRASNPHSAPYEVHGDPIPTEKYAYHATAELPSPPVEIMTNDNETVHGRAELSETNGSDAENMPRWGPGYGTPAAHEPPRGRECR